MNEQEASGWYCQSFAHKASSPVLSLSLIYFPGHPIRGRVRKATPVLACYINELIVSGSICANHAKTARTGSFDANLLFWNLLVDAIKSKHKGQLSSSFCTGPMLLLQKFSGSFFLLNFLFVSFFSCLALAVGSKPVYLNPQINPLFNIIPGQTSVNFTVVLDGSYVPTAPTGQVSVINTYSGQVLCQPTAIQISAALSYATCITTVFASGNLSISFEQKYLGDVNFAVRSAFTTLTFTKQPVKFNLATSYVSPNTGVIPGVTFVYFRVSINPDPSGTSPTGIINILSPYVTGTLTVFHILSCTPSKKLNNF